MDKDMEHLIKLEAKGRPYTVLRHVGNRIEVMFYGDYELTIIEKEEEGPQAQAWSEDDLPGIMKMTVAKLREVAKDLGIQVYNLKKAELQKEIKKYLKE